MKNSLYARLFASRAVLSFLVVIMMLLVCILRVAVIATDDYSAVAAEQSSYRINISRLRGTIYDCNMVPLTNNVSKTVAAVSPTPKGVLAISRCTSGTSLENSLNTLKSNKPTICTVEKTINSEGIAFTTVYQQADEKLSACHLLGYTDSSGHGVSGLQLAYDDFLYSDKFVSAIFTTGGGGDVLSGIEPVFDNDTSVINSGVVTTIDINIQNITEAAAAKMNSGCAIVAEVGSGKIRAMASVPTFELKTITESLQNPNSPMINRALSAYSVGSVFKPCVASAALEKGRGIQMYHCKGSLEIVDRVFRCHDLSGHGDMNLQGALAQSCNCFFYNFALNLGGEPIYKMASSLNFGFKIKVCDNMYTPSGIIPELKSLGNEGALANLSIGQGNLLLSPVSMLSLYLSIAGDGSYYLPSVVEKTVKDGAEDMYDIGNPTRVMSADTAVTLREYLGTVITDGTGSEAAPTLTTAAGKTATAQTGRYYEDGTEITNSWFCGFFPAENPEYVVVVMSDSRLNVSTASVFAKIADGITELYTKNVEFDG
ncbi:MAG: hypothetical protein IJZ21_02820 [Clostridia bacterium]|nr:hypothetical protein [Clostridia bacterium]